MKKWILGPDMKSGPATTNILKFVEADFLGTSAGFTQRNLGSSINSIASVGVNETINSITDSIGNILFYVFVNASSFNSSAAETTYFVAFDNTTGADEVFAAIPGIGTGNCSVKNLDIVKRYGFQNQYYVIYKTAAENFFSNDFLKYVLVDMNTKTISAPTNLISNANEGQATSPLNCSGVRWFFFVKQSGTTLNLYRSSISSSGISIPTIISTTTTTGGSTSSAGQGEIEISAQGDKIAYANYVEGAVNEDIIIWDLNLTTGSVSNQRYIHNPTNYILTLAFSPNGQRIYATRSGSINFVNELYNAPVPAPATNYTIQATDKINVPITYGFGIEAGYDGNLYFTINPSNSLLYYISNPNTDAVSNIVSQTPPNSFGVGNYVTMALPDQIYDDHSNSAQLSHLSIAAIPTIICAGQSATLTASGATNYQWSGGSNAATASISVTPSVTSTYSVQTTGNCADSASATIHVVSFSPAQFTYTYNGCNSTYADLINKTNTTNIIWFFGDGESSTLTNPTHLYAAGNYTITLIANANTSCADTSKQYISVIDVISPEILPNVFTPNNDGINDELTFSGLGNCIEYTLDIYNRWGLKVFETDTPKSVYWNGSVHATHEVSDGVYFYLLTPKNNASAATIKGNVSVIR